MLKVISHLLMRIRDICPVCEGKGEVYSTTVPGRGEMKKTRCDRCNGSGKYKPESFPQ